VPGLRDNLRPRRDIWGEKVIYDSGFLSPAYTSEAKNDPVNLELLKLGDYAPGYPSKTVKGRELSPEEYDGYQEQAGKLSHERLTGLVTSPAWKLLDGEEKTKAAKKIVDEAREDARDRLFGGSDEWFTFPDAKGADAPAAEDDPWSSFPDAASRDVKSDLEQAIPGVQFTSGFRDDAYNQNLKARGYQVADNSEHMDGAALDMLPPPGKSLGWLRAQVKRYDPKARLLVHDGHLHAAFDDYFGAPVLGGARAAGVVNPMAGSRG
jgi:hypothetical protein